MIEIKHQHTGKVIFTSKNTSLSYANLNGANLSGANLSDANLSDANLSDANLSGANLSDANLNGADLRYANLSGVDLRYANLSSVDLSDADLSDADLSDANLSGANLRYANLSDANLRYANLSGANLRSTDLSDANLRYVIGLAPEICTDLLMLLDQPGKIRAYKLIKENNQGPFRGGIKFKIGTNVSVTDANTDPTQQCGAGINVATLPWCLSNWYKGYKILIVEFTKKDIACIPTATDGKFRLHRCKIIAKKKLDYMALGLVKE